MSLNKLLPLVVVVGLAATPATPFVEADPGEEVNEVTIVASDYEFDAPDRMPAGVVKVRLVNQGTEMHHAQLMRLKDGKTLEDFAAAMASGESLDFAVWEGGPSIAPPGMETSATLQLRPGTYYWVCFIATPDNGMPHAEQGMVRPVVVEDGPSGELPEADNLVLLSDYDFKFAQPLTAGRHTIRVRNHAAQPHEIIVAKLMPGKSLDDLMAWMEAGEEGPPPALPIGGMQALDQGLGANFDLDLEPGDYGLICFVPDAKDGKPHTVHGMMKQFTVP